MTVEEALDLDEHADAMDAAQAVVSEMENAESVETMSDYVESIREAVKATDKAKAAFESLLKQLGRKGPR
jgi:hypothetical protein